MQNITNVSTGKLPDDFDDGYLDNASLPNYLLVAKTPDGWVRVHYNSFGGLGDWDTMLSKEFNCKLIMVSAQTTSDVYEFSLYDKGEVMREIIVCYGDDVEAINDGDRFDFEDKEILEPGDDEDEDKLFFDLDALEYYCKQFGLNIREPLTGRHRMDNSKRQTTKDHYRIYQRTLGA